jgi:FtsH-binding integral membrane protein
LPPPGRGPVEEETMADYNGAAYTPTPIEALGADSRARFIARTYNHLFGAILAFVGVEVFFFKSGLADRMAPAMLQAPWLLILGGFILVSWLASRAAHGATSKGVQYAALGGFVVAEAIIFLPMLYIAQHYAKGGVIESAATVTLIGFAGLTGIAFWTRKDFSFLGALLRWAVLLALVAIVAGAIFGFELGTWFSIAMIGVAGGAVLYDTSNVLHHYPEDRYVGAALELFASVALMFWYILRLFMSRD